jgi:hypothetical protein
MKAAADPNAAVSLSITSIDLLTFCSMTPPLYYPSQLSGALDSDSLTEPVAINPPILQLCLTELASPYVKLAKAYQNYSLVDSINHERLFAVEATSLDS